MRRIKQVALWIACSGLIIAAGACSRSNKTQILGLWSYTDTNKIPPLSFSILLSTNGQGALMAGQKTATLISFTYIQKRSEVQMKGLSHTGALGSLRYQPDSDTLLHIDTAGRQTTLWRDHDKVGTAILTGVLGASNEQQLMQRISLPDFSKAADYLRKPATNP